MKNSLVLFWFRRDLRLEDNVGLYHALSSGHQVLPIFIFDTEILNDLADSYDRRVDYIHQVLTAINNTLNTHGSSITCYVGNVSEIFEKLLIEYDVKALYYNRDYEPQAIKRDQTIEQMLHLKGVSSYSFKDQVIFEQSEITKDDGKPYTVYTPYAKKWRAQLNPGTCKSLNYTLDMVYKLTLREVPSLTDIGFRKTDIEFKPPQLEAALIDHYDSTRDFPNQNGTTQLGIAFRFGTISIRKAVAFAQTHNQTWLSELIWRDFFMQILFHFPQLINKSFKQQYDNIAWRNNEHEFALWCTGATGYPIVDAGMRQLNTTGYMHNRVRMIVASFLCKHLLIDWRWGEAYFASKLNDYDLAANNGNWQWAAGSGCDAAPYFRIFNPSLQTQKFDKDLEYIRTWLPNFEAEFKMPIVDHSYARARALNAYNKALKQL